MPLNPNRDSFAVSGLDGNFFFITSGPLKQLKFPCPSVTTDPPSKSPTTPRLPKLEIRGPPRDLLPFQNTEIRISPPDNRFTALSFYFWKRKETLGRRDRLREWKMREGG
jgi:hypothetical protein